MVVEELIEQLRQVRGSAPLMCRLSVIPEELVAVDADKAARAALTEGPLAKELTTVLYGQIDHITWEGGEVLIHLETC